MAFASPAAAQFGRAYDPTPVTPDELLVARQVAHDYWGRWPACGVPSIEWGTPSAQDGGAGWDTGGNAWALPSECKILLRPNAYDPSLYAWPDLCVDVVHELGHLLGFSHNPDPRNVMYFASDPASVLGCVSTVHRLRHHGRRHHVRSTSSRGA